MEFDITKYLMCYLLKLRNSQYKFVYLIYKNDKVYTILTRIIVITIVLTL